MTDVTVRAATADELPAVLGVLDGAALETDADRVRGAFDNGDDGDGAVDGGGAAAGTEVLVAVTADADTVLGALVLDGAEIANVAVRRRRRGQGIGSALVRAAAARRDRLVAEFDASVRPFYESLGFAVDPLAGCDGREGDDADSGNRGRDEERSDAGNGRYRGVLDRQ